MCVKRYVLPVLAVTVLVGCFFTLRQITEKAVVSTAKDTPFILVDPGHGGQDGGALTAENIKESDINLAIALPLRDMLQFCGYSAKMTRTEDVSIVHEDDAAQRSWKVKDMYNRLEMYDAAAFTVSIHQNHFSQEKYHGAQLFYSDNRPESRDMATCIRTQIITMLQPDNTRELKAAGENIFLLHTTQKPALIVECGFLSNKEEAEKLQDAQYRQQMAFAICCGILQYAPRE